jgi:hypothetical protein
MLMSGNNGRGVLLKPERLAAVRRPTPPAEARAEQFHDDLAGRLGDRLQVVVREQISIEVVPRLDALEAKVAGLSRPRIPSAPAEVPTRRQALQRQARNRVD